jgi:hypothetical protein
VRSRGRSSGQGATDTPTDTSDISEETPDDEESAEAPNVPTEYINALAKAKDYFEGMSMSKDAVYEQLISEYGEQFTPEQAQYAVDRLE